MAVGSSEAVPALVEDVPGLLQGRFAVIACYRSEVELEQNSNFVQSVIVLGIEVTVTLGMGKQRPVSGAHDILEHAVQVVWFCHHRGFHQEDIVLHRQQVAVLESLLEYSIEHVLGREAELDRAFVDLAEFCEAGLEVGGAVGAVFHDMRGAPPFLHSEQLAVGKDLKALLHILDAVVHSRKYVGMTIDSALEEAVLR